MSNQHYDSMYQATQSNRSQIKCLDYPTTRWEFAIKHAIGGDVLLDIGCGSGEILYSLSNKYNKLIGFDVSERRINVAKSCCEGLTTEFFIDEFDKSISLTHSSVDTAICLDVLDHMLDVRKALSNIYSVLKQNGQLIISVPNIARIDNRLRLLRGLFPSTSTSFQGFTKLGSSDLFDGGKLHYFTFSSFIMLLKETGFSQINKYGIGRFKQLHNIYPELLSGSISLVCNK